MRSIAALGLVFAMAGCAADNPRFGKSPAVASGGGSGDEGPDGGDTSATGADDSTDGEDVLDGPPEEGDGTTGSDDAAGTDTGGEFQRVRCKGLLWGINEAGNILLIDVHDRTSEIVANAGTNVWAAATARSGLLVLVPKGANAPVIGVDPTTGELMETYVASLGNDDEASRAGAHPDGSIWVGTYGAGDAPSSLIRVKLSEGEFEPLGFLDALPEGGDHILASESNMISVGFDGRVAVVTALEDEDPVVVFLGQLGAPGSRWTGIGRAEGQYWVSEADGRLFSLLPGDGAAPFTLDESFQADAGVDDLAPVILSPEDCIHGVED